MMSSWQALAIEQVAVIDPKEGILRTTPRLPFEIFLDYGGSQTRSLENSRNLQKDNQGVSFGFGRNDLLSKRVVLTTSGELQVNFIDMKMNDSSSLIDRDYGQTDYGISEKFTYLTSSSFLPNFIFKVGHHWGKETITDTDLLSSNFQEFQREYKRISAATGFDFKVGETKLYVLFERSHYYLDEVLQVETRISGETRYTSGLIRSNNDFYTEKFRFGFRVDF